MNKLYNLVVADIKAKGSDRDISMATIVWNLFNGGYSFSFKQFEELLAYIERRDKEREGGTKK